MNGSPERSNPQSAPSPFVLDLSEKLRSFEDEVTDVRSTVGAVLPTQVTLDKHARPMEELIARAAPDAAQASAEAPPARYPAAFEYCGIQVTLRSAAEEKAVNAWKDRNERAFAAVRPLRNRKNATDWALTDARYAMEIGSALYTPAA